MVDIHIIERPNRDTLGEGPFWSGRQNALFWVDILGHDLHRLSVETGAITSWKMPDVIGWAIERTNGDMVAGIGRGIYTLQLDPFVLSPFADLETHIPGNRVNDAKADASGRLWAGTMPFGADVPAGNLYSIEPDGTVKQRDTGYHVANGPAIDPAGDYLYHTNSVLGQIYRFAISSDGSLGPRELFLQFAPNWGSPDGMTFDARGGLWVAHWGGGRVSRFLGDGRLDYAINLPASQITSCCFGGKDLDQLFITSASTGSENEKQSGALFQVCTEETGLTPSLFMG
jgi:xylono-1,5-lactonase